MNRKKKLDYSKVPSLNIGTWRLLRAGVQSPWQVYHLLVFPQKLVDLVLHGRLVEMCNSTLLRNVNKEVYWFNRPCNSALYTVRDNCEKKLKWIYKNGANRRSC